MGRSGFFLTTRRLSKSTIIWLALTTGLLAIALPIAASMYWAWKHNLDKQTAFASSIAREILRKTGNVLQEVGAIHKALSRADMHDPCSRENIGLMEQLNLRSNLVQNIVYLQDTTLLCSAYGIHDLQLPPPDFTSARGTRIWLSQGLPGMPGVRFLILAPEGRGYAVMVLPQTLLDFFSDDPDISAGLYSLQTHEVIASRGSFRQRWLWRLGDARQARFTDEQLFIIVQRSGEYDIASYVALPIANFRKGLINTALMLLPIGLLAGALLALSIFFLARYMLSLPAVIRAAIRRKEFSLHYQPVVDLQTGQWKGAEVLLRWQRPSGESVPPDVFIQAAENHNLIHALTELMMQMVIRDARQFFRQFPDFHLAINLSAMDLESPCIIEELRTLRTATAAQDGNLLVEVTERSFLNTDSTRDTLRAIQDMGIRVAIDDFGTGYSSLSYLEHFDVDLLKIDKFFINTVGQYTPASQVVTHIIEIGKSLKLSMIAEGVETEAQAQYLRAQGVQLAQGWLFARPMPFEALVRQLQQQAQR